MNPRWTILAVLTTVVLLGLVPAAQAEVRVSPNYRLAGDSNPFRGQDQTALAVKRTPGSQHVVQVNANYLDLICEASVSRDGGTTWSAPVPLPFPAPAAGQSPFIPSCSTYQSVEFGSGDNVYTTATAARVSPDFPDSSTLVWKSTDGGTTWGPGVVAMAGGPGRTATGDPFVGPSYSRPSLSVVPNGGTGGTSDRVYLTALGGNFNSVRVAVSNDSGGTFNAGVTASPPAPPTITDTPSKPVVNSDGSVTIAWRTQGREGLLQASRSTDGGATWGTPVNIATVTNTGTSTTTHIPSNPPTGQSTSGAYPRMVGGGPAGHLYLVFQQGVGGINPPAYEAADHFINPAAQVYFTRSTDNGETWSTPKRISERTSFPGARTHQTRHPTVSFANGRINIVWHDRRHWYAGPGERNCTHTHIFCQDIRLGDTYLSSSTDAGGSFSKPLRISDRSNNDEVGYDTRPSAYWNYGPQSVTVGDGKLLVGWMDSRNGNWDTDNEDTYLAKVDFNATGAPPTTTTGQSDAISRSVALAKLAYPAGNEGALVGGRIDPARPEGCESTIPASCPGGVASRNASAVVIVNQSDVAGALAGAVLARMNPSAVLVSPASGLPASVKAEVARLRPAGAFVIGDTSKLSAQVVADLDYRTAEEKLPNRVPAPEIKRLGDGSDAATAALIAAEMDKRSVINKDVGAPAFDAAVIANPASPDAAAAAGLAAARRLPYLYTTPSGSIPAETQAALTALNIDKTLVIGRASDVPSTAGLPDPTRLGGANQYETSRAVVAESKARGLPENVVYFADGAKPMDAALLGNVVARATGILALAPAPLATTAAAQAADFGLTGISRLFLAVPAAPGSSPRPTSPGPGPGPGPGATAAFAGCPTLTANVIRGTAAANTITGTTAADRIFAGTGNDVVDALAGNDCVDLGTGDDRGQGGLGNDLMVAGTGRDRISGSSGNDNMRGNSGHDRLAGGRGNDRLFGDSGNDTLLGSFGNDRLHGVSGKDLITGSRGRDRINGGSGNDKISGGSSADRISGDAGRDRINGNSGADRIKGNSGADRITSADSSRDRVNCGSGRDTVIADRRDVISRNCEIIRRRR